MDDGSCNLQKPLNSPSGGFVRTFVKEGVFAVCVSIRDLGEVY